MSFITKDTFPIAEIERFLVGKMFCRQSKVTNEKTTGKIESINQSFKMVFIAEFQKAFYKSVITIKSDEGVWYNLDEIFIESVMPYQNLGGAIVAMDAVNNPFPTGGLA
jgi:hypothetical protein